MMWRRRREKGEGEGVEKGGEKERQAGRQAGTTATLTSGSVMRMNLRLMVS